MTIPHGIYAVESAATDDLSEISSEAVQNALSFVPDVMSRARSNRMAVVWKKYMKRMLLRLLPVFDLLIAPFVYLSSWVLKLTRVAGVHRLPISRALMRNVGVFPIRDHYYEPQFNYSESEHSLSSNRNLSGINWNTEEQLNLLSSLTYAEELKNIPKRKPDTLEFYFGNCAFESGDAEYWYQLIRFTKPSRIFEIGSGYSTLMAVKAIAENQKEDHSYRCKHVCIEPYEMPWLEKLDILVIRNKIEDTDPSFFSELGENDILFIDSSHVIRPRGDVLFEYLELLPSLNKGVIVHVHDIFSPRNYPDEWLKDEVRLWNEQYILEAFLSQNKHWEIIGALNYLHHNHYEKLHAIAPYLSTDREPGSFYMQKKSDACMGHI